MERLSAQTAAKIEQDILSGGLPPGERLPSEEKLCVQFGCSRTVIREALQQLRGRGLLHSLKGSGTYIADPSLKSLGSAIETYSALSDSADFLELIDFRILIETECTRLATVKLGNLTLRDLRRCLDKMIEARGSRADFSKTDINFHFIIAKASGNSIYAALLGALERRCIEFAQANRADDDWYAHVINAHRSVLDAMEAGHSEQAAEAMRRHLLSSRRHFVDVND